jgi:hypothetical protein
VVFRAGGEAHCIAGDTETVDPGVASADSGVPQVLFGLLGAEPTSLQRLTMGYSSSRTYLVEVADSMVVVKVSDDPLPVGGATGLFPGRLDHQERDDVRR